MKKYSKYKLKYINLQKGGAPLQQQSPPFSPYPITDPAPLPPSNPYTTAISKINILLDDNKKIKELINNGIANIDKPDIQILLDIQQNIEKNNANKLLVSALEDSAKLQKILSDIDHNNIMLKIIEFIYSKKKDIRQNKLFLSELKLLKKQYPSKYSVSITILLNLLNTLTEYEKEEKEQYKNITAEIKNINVDTIEAFIQKINEYLEYSSKYLSQIEQIDDLVTQKNNILLYKKQNTLYTIELKILIAKQLDENLNAILHRLEENRKMLRKLFTDIKQKIEIELNEINSIKKLQHSITEYFNKQCSESILSINLQELEHLKRKIDNCITQNNTYREELDSLIKRHSTDPHVENLKNTLKELEDDLNMLEKKNTNINNKIEQIKKDNLQSIEQLKNSIIVYLNNKCRESILPTNLQELERLKIKIDKCIIQNNTFRKQLDSLIKTHSTYQRVENLNTLLRQLDDDLKMLEQKNTNINSKIEQIKKDNLEQKDPLIITVNFIKSLQMSKKWTKIKNYKLSIFLPIVHFFDICKLYVKLNYNK